MVAGRWVIHDHHHPQGAAIANAFSTVMAELWH